MKFINYTPKIDSFPFKTINFLQKNGESKNSDIRKAIGLNEWSSTSDYSDRSNYYFGCIVTRLMDKNIIKRTRVGFYELILKK